MVKSLPVRIDRRRDADAAAPLGANPALRARGDAPRGGKRAHRILASRSSSYAFDRLFRSLTARRDRGALSPPNSARSTSSTVSSNANRAALARALADRARLHHLEPHDDRRRDPTRDLRALRQVRSARQRSRRSPRRAPFSQRSAAGSPQLGARRGRRAVARRTRSRRPAEFDCVVAFGADARWTRSRTRCAFRRA